MSQKSKKTMPEEWGDHSEGAWAAAGFAIVLIVVGLPVWWYTTTVYRANLPYSTIEDLASSFTYQTVHINIITDKPEEFRTKIENEFLPNNGLVRFSVAARKPQKEEKVILSLTSLQSIEEQLSKLRIYHAGTFSIYVLSNQKDLPISPSILISRKRLLIMKESTDVKTLGEVLHSMALDSLAQERLKGHTEELSSGNVDRRMQLLRQVPTEPGYDITLTLMLPQPHLLMANWNVSEAIDEYFSSLKKQFEEVADLRIRSQILYMTSLKVSPKWSDKYQHFALPQHQLPLTINAIEAKLGSFVSTRPSLHFIVYIPRDSHTPLHIHTKDGIPVSSNSFLVPRWGGVLIHNPTNVPTDWKNVTLPYTFPIDSNKVMQTIITHLYKLLPIPQVEPQDNILVCNPDDAILSDWQLDGLARARILMYLNSIKITLQSLCDLVGEISNMVVSDEVAGWVWAAVEDWRRCLQSGREGRVRDATIECTDAFKHSDAAFFHPSMLALLYFPDNQKYAIYIPLFLPVSIPVILSLKMIFKIIRNSKKKSKEE